jgi:nitrite reductase (NADH) large subunit
VQHRGQTYGLVAPLWEQGRVLADVLSGRKPQACYQGSRLATKLKVLGVEVASMGDIHGAPDDEIVTYCERKRGRYKKLVIRDNRLVGAILLGDLDQAASLAQTFENRTVLPANPAELLFEIGSVKKGVVMLEMPDDAKVCNCNNVTKGDVRLAVEAGQTSLPQIMSCTRAGTGCGSCKKLVQEIVDWVCDSQAKN